MIQKIFIFLAGSLMVLCIVCATTQAKISESIIIGTSGLRGMYYPTGGAICRTVNTGKDRHGIFCNTESTKGSVDNIKAYESGDLQFGIAKSDHIYQAYRGLTLWQGKPQKNLRTIFSVQGESVHLIADSRLDTIQDLKGKKVNIGHPGSIGRMDSLIVLNAYGINLEDINESNLRIKEAVELFKKGQIDAFFNTVVDPNGITLRISKARKISIIPFEGPEVDELITQYPYYEKTVIPSSWYPMVKNKGDIPAFGYKTIFFTSTEASEEVVYRITKEIFNNVDKFKKQHPAFHGLTQHDMVNILDTIAPIHPGALRYYREVGLSPIEKGD